MKRRKLEMLLEEVESFQEPDVILEQYSTPATVASDMLHFAYMKGDIEDKKIYDLGCGTGILSIGCKLLGAAEVTGFDSDERALNIARANAKKMDVDIDFIYSDIEEVSGHAQTIVMNPPFGAQKKGSDRPFIKKHFQLVRSFIQFIIGEAMILSVNTLHLR